MSQTKMNEDYCPSQKTIDKMIGQYPGVNINYEQEKFVDHYISTGDTRENWDAAFRNWIRRADEYSSKQTSNHVATSTNAIQTRKGSLYRVAKQGNTNDDGQIKRFPKSK